MKPIIKNTILTVFFVGSIGAGIYTVCNSLGLFDSKPEPRRITAKRPAAPPPPVPQELIDKMRERGVSEERIQKMIQTRNQAYEKGSKAVTTSNYRYKRSVAQSAKEMQSFIDSAAKIQRAKAPAPGEMSTLLVAPFELDPHWYRNQLAAVNLADLVMASLGSQPDIQLVDRQQINQAVNEMTLSLGMDINQSMRLGAMLKADMILRNIVIQDPEQKQTTLNMQVVDTSHTSILVQQTLTLQADYRGHFAPTDDDWDLINQTVPTLVERAIIQRQKLTDKLLIAPLFIHNRSSSKRLSHYQEEFRSIIQTWEKDSDIHILQIAGLEHTGREQAMGLTGLSEYDPNAWQYVADQYLWGYYAEGKYPDNTPVDDIPVTIKLYSWDGLNLPTEIEHQTTIADFQSAMQKAISELKANLSTTRSDQICEGLNKHIAHSLISELKGDKQYRRDQIDLALFFDPLEYKIAMMRAQPAYHYNNRVEQDHFHQIKSKLNRWEDFCDRFPLAPVKETARPTSLYLSSLILLIKEHCYLQKANHSSSSSQDWHIALRTYPRDMPLDVIKQTYQRTLARCERLSAFLPSILDQSDKNRRNEMYKHLNELDQVLDQLVVQNAGTRQARQAVQRLIAREQQAHAEYAKWQEEIKSRHSSTHSVKPAKPTTSVAAQQSGPKVDPQILKTIERMRKSNRQRRNVSSNMLVLGQAPVHPAAVLDVPHAHWPVTMSCDATSRNHYGMGSRSSSEKKVKLIVDHDQVGMIETQERAFFFNAAFNKPLNNDQQIKNATGLNDLIIYQNKAYLSYQGITIIDLDTGDRKQIGIKEGLANIATTGMTRVGQQLMVCHSDHRISLVDLQTHKIIERKLSQETQSMFNPTGKNMQAIGQWIFIDDGFLYDFKTSQVKVLGQVLHERLGDQLAQPGYAMPNGKYIKRPYSSIRAELSTSHQNDLYLTTRDQLIHLNMQNQDAHAWKLPMDLQPDMITADDGRLYLAYRQAELANHQRRPRLEYNLASKVHWLTHILVWDIQQQAITQRHTLPGDVLAMDAANGHLWAAMSFNGRRLILDMQTDHPDAHKPLDLTWPQDQPLKMIAGTKNKHMAIRLAYAGQLDPLIEWAKQLMQTNSNQASTLRSDCLNAAMLRGQDQQIIELARVFYPEDKLDISDISSSLKHALIAKRASVYKALLALCQLDPPTQFSEAYFKEKSDGYWSYRDKQQWENKARTYGGLKRLAQFNHLFELRNQLAAYNPPARYQSLPLWYHPRGYTNHNTRSITLTPLTVSILQDDLELFEQLCKSYDRNPSKDQNALIAALASHRPTYLQTLLNTIGMNWATLKLDQYDTLIVMLNAQRVAELTQWQSKKPSTDQIQFMLKFASALNDQALIDRTISQVTDPNDPKLLAFIISMHDTRLLDLMAKQGWNVSSHTPMSVLDRHTRYHLETIDWLIEHGFPVNQRDESGQTLLMHCADVNQTAACYLLMQAGADLTLKNKAGQTALNLTSDAQTRDLLNNYIETPKETAIVRVDQPRPDHLDDQALDQLLVAAIQSDEHDQAMQYMAWRNKDRGLYALSSNGFKVSPLMYASCRGDLPLVQSLIEVGCKVDERQSEGWTPLMYACANGHAQVTDYLLERGADWQEANEQHLTALDLARLHKHDQVIEVFEKRHLPQQYIADLLEAIMRRDMKRLTHLVKVQGYNINAEDEYGQTVLFFAFNAFISRRSNRFFPQEFWRDYDLFDQLIELGADIKHVDEQGLTVLGRYFKRGKITSGYYSDDMDGPLHPLRFLIKHGILKHADQATREAYIELFNRTNHSVKQELKDKVIALLKGE